jgi:hypothetical protein
MLKRNRSSPRTRMPVRFAPLIARMSMSFSYGYFAAKSQLTKSNQSRQKLENLARELQKVRHPFPPRLASPHLVCLTSMPFPTCALPLLSTYLGEQEAKSKPSPTFPASDVQRMHSAVSDLGGQQTFSDQHGRSARGGTLPFSSIRDFRPSDRCLGRW